MFTVQVQHQNIRLFHFM